MPRQAWGRPTRKFGADPALDAQMAQAQSLRQMRVLPPRAPETPSAISVGPHTPPVPGNTPGHPYGNKGKRK